MKQKMISILSILVFSLFIGLALLSSHNTQVNATEGGTSVDKNNPSTTNQESDSTDTASTQAVQITENQNIDSIVIRFLEDFKQKDYQIVKYFENCKDQKVTKEKAEQFTKKIYKKYTDDKQIKDVKLLNVERASDFHTYTFLFQLADKNGKESEKEVKIVINNKGLIVYKD